MIKTERKVTRETRTSRIAGVFLSIPLLFSALSATSALSLSALSQSVPLQPIDPTTLAAKESHEGLLVAADNYTDAARSKARFGKSLGL